MVLNIYLIAIPMLRIMYKEVIPVSLIFKATPIRIMLECYLGLWGSLGTSIK